MRKIYDWIRTDGVLHIAVSALLMIVLGWMKPICVPIILVVCIGVFKEAYDRISGRGTAEWHDLICDAIGIALGIVFIGLAGL